MSPPHVVTEDTPADMLAGSMDLDIILPSGHVVRTSVLRSTPMMDLLVQVTTAQRLSPGSHSLQAMGERGELPYKPSTPIGALDTLTIRIVQKKSNIVKKTAPVPTTLLHTFRLQVHLPRSQLFVMRVDPGVTVGEVMKKVSAEKNLDPLKYELRKTGNMGQRVLPEQTLKELDTQELTLVVRGSDPVRQLSSADIMHVKQANNRIMSSACDSSLSSGSLDSRSISPIAAPAPQPPQRKKRRPAPKPPENQMRISHSRESSDSSGYHEPSTLSESPTHGGPPRTNGLSSMTPRNSQSMSSLTSIPSARLAPSSSVTSLSSNGGKKKRAPPPPSQAVATPEKPKAATLPAENRRSVPPAPVELAPSPPTSPAVIPPVPRPRLPSSAEKNRLEKFHKQSAIEESDVILEDTKEETHLTKDEPSPKPETAEKPDNLRPEVFKPKKIIPVIQKSEIEQPSKEEAASLREIKSSPVFRAVLKTPLPKVDSEVLDFSKVFNSSDLSRWDEMDNLNESEGYYPLAKSPTRFDLGSDSTLGRKDSVDDSELEELEGADSFEEETTNRGAGNLEPATSSDGRTTDGESQPDSLTVDWEYQLPPPPTHFRDYPATSPTPTDMATLGTVDTLNTLIVDKSATIRKLNGIYEENEPKIERGQDEVDRAADVLRKNRINSLDRETNLIEKKESEKVLTHKADVMSELTNVLSRNRLPEKSQSYTNLFCPSAHFESKKKSNTLSHSQSFLNPPISNFKISNYQSRNSLDDGEFKKPLPKMKSAGVRRSDSMNVKKVNVDSMEILQQQFLQFLQEKQMLDSGVELEDLNVVPVEQKRHSFQEKLEVVSDIPKEDRKASPVIVDEIRKTVCAEVNETQKTLPVVYQEEKIEDVKTTEQPQNIHIVEDRKELITDSAVSNTAVKREETKVEIKGNTEVKTETVKIVPETVQVVKNEAKDVVNVVEPKKESPKRFIYRPPAISMGTWGERPKSKVLIQDDDYITQAGQSEKRFVLEKSASMSVVENKTEPPRIEASPKTPDKKNVIFFKKPTNYELFSALSKRKELEVEAEKVERLPKVCAVELKKEFRTEPDLIQGLETVKKVDVPKPVVPKATSVYLNGAPKPWNVEAQNSTKVRPAGLMPVVKGFRAMSRVESAPENVNIPPITNKPEDFRRQQSLPSKVPEPVMAPPPPPMAPISLKPVAARELKPKHCDADPRDQLLEQIRNFGGTGRLRKSVQ